MKYQNAVQGFHSKFNYDNVITGKEYIKGQDFLSVVRDNDLSIDGFFRACRVASYAFPAKDSSEFLDSFDNLNDLPVESVLSELYQGIILNYTWIDYSGNYNNIGILLDKLKECNEKAFKKTFIQMVKMSINRSPNNKLFEWIIANSEKYGFSCEDLFAGFDSKLHFLSDLEYHALKNTNVLSSVIAYNSVVRQDGHLNKMVNDLSIEDLLVAREALDDSHTPWVAEHILYLSNAISKLLDSGKSSKAEYIVSELDFNGKISFLRDHIDRFSMDFVIETIESYIDDITFNNHGIVQDDWHFTLRTMCSEIVSYLSRVIDSYIKNNSDTYVNINPNVIAKAASLYVKLHYLAENNEYVPKSEFTVDILGSNKVVYLLASHQAINEQFFSDKLRLSNSLIISIEEKIDGMLSDGFAVEDIDLLIRSVYPFKSPISKDSEIRNLAVHLPSLLERIFNKSEIPKHEVLMEYLIGLRMEKISDNNVLPMLDDNDFEFIVKN